MSSATPLLAALNITRLKQDTTDSILRGITLTVAAGDRLALRGSTGSGKTILLRSLAKLDPIFTGQILWQGNSPEADEVPIFRSQVIYLPQRARLFGGTVEQNLQIPYSLAVHRHRAYSRERLAASLNQLGRDETFLTRDSANLSGGETQIVALLRAIQLDPTILLLDEPTASLDESTTRQIEQLVTNWMSPADARRAFVWVTHDAAQAKRVANRTLQLRDAELIELETVP